MKRTYSFKFLDEVLNRRLLSELKKRSINHTVDTQGIIRYSAGNAEYVENELISSIRKQVFASWQILSCPADWVERYKQHMLKNQIPFVEELNDEQLWFLIPSRHRPHSWILKDVTNVAKRTIRFPTRAKTA